MSTQSRLCRRIAGRDDVGGDAGYLEGLVAIPHTGAPYEDSAPHDL